MKNVMTVATKHKSNGKYVDINESLQISVKSLPTSVINLSRDQFAILDRRRPDSNAADQFKVQRRVI